jgi:hypothetical protein
MEASSEFEYDLLEDSCLARDECIDSLISDAPADCIYCRLKLMDEEDWD